MSRTAGQRQPPRFACVLSIAVVASVLGACTPAPAASLGVAPGRGDLLAGRPTVAHPDPRPDDPSDRALGPRLPPAARRADVTDQPRSDLPSDHREHPRLDRMAAPRAHRRDGTRFGDGREAGRPRRARHHRLGRSGRQAPVSLRPGDGRRSRADAAHHGRLEGTRLHVAGSESALGDLPRRHRQRAGRRGRCGCRRRRPPAGVHRRVRADARTRPATHSTSRSSDTIITQDGAELVGVTPYADAPVPADGSGWLDFLELDERLLAGATAFRLELHFFTDPTFTTIDVDVPVTLR